MNMLINVVDQTGSSVNKLEIPVDLSNFVINEITLYRVVNAINHNMNRVRSGHYKNISGLVGSTRKIRPQKRTGKSRQGAKREIHMRGGAVKFGFTGDKQLDMARRFRSYKKINRKESRLAMIQLLANRYQNNKLTVIDTFMNVSKTKDAVTQFEKLQIRKPIIVYGSVGISKAYNNLMDKSISNVCSLNAYKVISKPEIILDVSAMKFLFKLN